MASEAPWNASGAPWEGSEVSKNQGLNYFGNVFKMWCFSKSQSEILLLLAELYKGPVLNENHRNRTCSERKTMFHSIHIISTTICMLYLVKSNSKNSNVHRPAGRPAGPLQTGQPGGWPDGEHLNFLKIEKVVLLPVETRPERLRNTPKPFRNNSKHYS